MIPHAALGKKLAVGATALLTALSLTACGANAKADSDDLRIGYLAHLTGPTAGPYGLPFDKGIKLGVEAVNESGVLGDLKLTLDRQDVGGEVPSAITQYNKFLREDISIFISPSSTPIQRALQPYMEKDDAVLLSSSVGDETKEKPGGVFALPDAITPNENFGKYIADEGAKTAVMLVDGENPAFKDIAAALQEGYEEAGGEVVEEIDISAEDNDFSPVVTKIQAASPDAVFFSTLSETAGNLMIQMERSGGFEDVQMAGGVSWGKQVYDVAGDVAVGAQFAAYWAPADGGEFEKRFLEEYDVPPESVSATGYQTAWLIAGAASLAVEAGEDVDGAAIAKYMPQAAETDIVKENGTYESWAFRDSGTAIYPGVVMEFDETGTIVPVSK